MNGYEIQHLIRSDLQRAVSRNGVPPVAWPIEVSPWLAMSLLQKAIRRGCEELALRAAATLLRDAPDRLWRRLGCIAAEDVGVADFDTIGLATAALAGKRFRAGMGGEWAVAACLVSELSRAIKCRAADDLFMSSELHPVYANARAELSRMSTRELIVIATNAGPIHERALALQFALGTERRSSRLVSRRGEPRLAFDLLCEAGWPHSIVEIARENSRRTGEVLAPLVALLSREVGENSIIRRDEHPPEILIGDIRVWALDLYSREGRACYARLLQTNAPSAKWICHHVKPGRRVAFIGHLIFRVEGGVCLKRLHWPLADELRRQVDIECAGPECPDATEILELVRADIPRLNEVRAATIGGSGHAQ